MTSDRWTRLADLAVHAANVQPGQIMAVSAELEQDELARAIAAAAYRRGAQFVDIWYFDPYLKRARVENADPETLEYVPQWYGDRMLAHAAAKGARVSLGGPDEARPAQRPRRVARRQGSPAVAEGDGQDRRRAEHELGDPAVPAPGLGDARLPRPLRGRGLREAVERARARAPARRARSRRAPGRSGWRR